MPLIDNLYEMMNNFNYKCTNESREVYFLRRNLEDLSIEFDKFSKELELMQVELEEAKIHFKAVSYEFRCLNNELNKLHHGDSGYILMQKDKADLLNKIREAQPKQKKLQIEVDKLQERCNKIKDNFKEKLEDFFCIIMLPRFEQRNKHKLHNPLDLERLKLSLKHQLEHHDKEQIGENQGTNSTKCSRIQFFDDESIASITVVEDDEYELEEAFNFN